MGGWGWGGRQKQDFETSARLPDMCSLSGKEREAKKNAFVSGISAERFTGNAELAGTGDVCFTSLSGVFQGFLANS